MSGWAARAHQLIGDGIRPSLTRNFQAQFPLVTPGPHRSVADQSKFVGMREFSKLPCPVIGTKRRISMSNLAIVVVADIKPVFPLNVHE